MLVQRRCVVKVFFRVFPWSISRAWDITITQKHLLRVIDIFRYQTYRTLTLYEYKKKNARKFTPSLTSQNLYSNSTVETGKLMQILRKNSFDPASLFVQLQIKDFDLEAFLSYLQIKLESNYSQLHWTRGGSVKLGPTCYRNVFGLFSDRLLQMFHVR